MALAHVNSPKTYSKITNPPTACLISAAGRPCVVVSPLIALMEDQVAALTARGVKAAMLGSAQNKVEVRICRPTG